MPNVKDFILERSSGNVVIELDDNSIQTYSMKDVGSLANEFVAAGEPSFARQFSWATLPPPADYIGTAFITDVGLRGSLWRSDGATWGVVGGSVVLANNWVAGTAVTGSTSETLFSNGTFTVRGGLMGLNGSLRIEQKLTFTNSANTKTLRVRLGGIGGTAVNDPQVVNLQTAHITTQVDNRNSQSSQIGSNGSVNLSAATNNWRNATINTAVDWDIALTGQLASAGETLTLEGYRITLLRP